MSELLGHGLFDRVHVADRPAYLTALADAAALGEARSVEFRVRRDPPRTIAGAAELGCAAIHLGRDALPAARPAPAATPASREVVAVMRDVTERKMQEQALEDARAEAERANAAKSKFLANMSHELRTPLNAIIGFSEMLMNEERMRLDAARRREYAKLINDSGKHLLAVVNGILDMSKMETGDFEITPEPFAPAQVIGNCCDLLALKAREGGLDLAIAAACRPAGDRRRQARVQADPAQSDVQRGQVHRPRRPRHGQREHRGADILVAVEDTGVGISADDLPRVGKPFFQARGAYDRRHDGTGLGLSIVKGLVALHGGEVDIASRLGEGTRVTVRLPLDCEAVRPAAKPLERGASFVRPGGRSGRSSNQENGVRRAVRAATARLNDDEFSGRSVARLPLVLSGAVLLRWRCAGRGDSIAAAVAPVRRRRDPGQCAVHAIGTASGADLRQQARAGRGAADRSAAALAAAQVRPMPRSTSTRPRSDTGGRNPARTVAARLL